MPHFFINSKNVNNNCIVIDDNDTYRHIARALRVRKGEQLLLIDENQIQYETIVTEVTNSEVIVNVENSYKSLRSLPFGLYLAQSPLRSDAQSFVIEKATEIGVKGVYPICTDNCAVSKETIDKKVEKWQRIMFEASKQCERADVPTCFAPCSLEDMVKNFDRIIVFCERIASKTLKDIKPIQKDEDVLVIIGPEGGFSDNEFAALDAAGARGVSLGKTILRAELAAAIAVAKIAG